jgi:polyisoprenoid-binding protein YceI
MNLGSHGIVTATALLLLASLPGRTVEGQTPAELHGTAAIDFTGSSTLHDFSGTGAAHAFRVRRNADTGRWDAEVEVPVAALDTGNRWRDDGMRRMLDATQCPTIKGSFAGIDPVAVQADGRISFDLTICSVIRPITATVSSWQQDDHSAHFTADFDVSLAAFELAAPRTLFIKVDDIVHVRVQATLRTD